MSEDLHCELKAIRALVDTARMALLHGNASEKESAAEVLLIAFWSLSAWLESEHACRGEAVLTHAHHIKDMANTISEWAGNQPVGDAGRLDAGDIAALSDLIVVGVDRIIEVSKEAMRVKP